MFCRMMILNLMAATLVACGGEPGEEPGHASSPEAPKISASAGELWDTDLTYGAPPDPNSTGVERGRQLYDQNCSICHAQGVGMAGTESLRRSFAARGETERDPILANRTDLNGTVIRTFVRYGTKSMSYFRKTEVSDEDLDLIVEYLTRNNPPSGE